MAPTTLKECHLKTDLADRQALSSEQALDLSAIFKILANNTRLRLLHALIREGELCVKDVSETIDMKPQAVSNQLHAERANR